MKTVIVTISLCMVLGHALAQTNQAYPDLSALQWTSQSKTVETYRQRYPQLTNMTDDRLVVAIGNKFPQILKTDSVFSNEFSALTTSSAKESVPAEPDDQITTRQNEIFHEVKIIKADPEGLTISYTDSTSALLMTRLKFEDLSDVLQRKYHYDPQAALDYQNRQQQTMIDLRNRLEINDHAAQQAENQRADEGVQAYKDRQQQKLNEQMAQTQQKAAEAQQKAADAAMLQAAKPPQQVNVIQQQQQGGYPFYPF